MLGILIRPIPWPVRDAVGEQAGELADALVNVGTALVTTTIAAAATARRSAGEGNSSSSAASESSASPCLIDP